MASEAFEAAVEVFGQAAYDVALDGMFVMPMARREYKDARAALLAAHAAAVAEAEARGRADALREVDEAVEALAMRPDVPECAVALDYDGWYVSRSGSNGHPTPTAAILAAARALSPDAYARAQAKEAADDR